MKKVKIIKNPLVRMQKFAITTLCLVCTLFFMFSGCDKQNSVDGDAGIDTFFEQLKSAPFIDISQETFPEWLVVRINDYHETWPSSICKVLIYKGEWNEQTVYFIMNAFSSCLCDFFTENGGRIGNNLSDLYATSKNWIIIYEYGDFVIDLNELYKN